MKSEKTVRLQIKLVFTDQDQAQDLQAYAYTSQGGFVGSAALDKGAASVEIPAEFDGRMLDVILGPRVDRDQPVPTAAGLKRMGAYAQPVRFLVEKPRLEIKVPSVVFPKWCLCWVRGRLVKRFTLPDGTHKELPVCNARVHVCEVDRLSIVIPRLPDRDILRLRDDLLDKLRVVPWPIPPRPWPGPGPLRGPLTGPATGPSPGPLVATMQPHAASLASAAPQTGGLSEAASQSVVALATSRSVAQLRARLIDLSSIIAIHLCDLQYLWSWFRVDCLTTANVDSEGRFTALVINDCKDRPDLYFWVEQFQDGAWVTVYRPSIGCGTHWNHACGSEIVLNLPGAVACEEPSYEVPPGVTLFVLPWAVAHVPIWGIPPGSAPAPFGWLRSDGHLDYLDDVPTTALGALYNAPFGGTLNFIHDDSYFIPSSGIKYYRYAYRRVTSGSSPNTGASDPTWTPIATPLARGYRLEYSGGRLPTYESYPVGPATHGPHSGLFEFKPQQPPNPGGTVVASEWLSGNASEVAASWNTLLAAPPLSADNTTDDAGAFEIKIEVFDPAGNQVMPGASTLRFLARNADGTTTRLATPAEEAGGAYVFRVQVDNNGVEAELPQPSIGGVAASDDCGFLRYQAGDSVHVQYRAAHPNNHAVFGFAIKRGSNGLALATTLAPYVEVAAASAPTASAPYNKSAGFYQRDFAPADLVGTCVNAAFAASLGVHAKATNGDQRLGGMDTWKWIAFALAEQEGNGTP